MKRIILVFIAIFISCNISQSKDNVIIDLINNPIKIESIYNKVEYDVLDFRIGDNADDVISRLEKKEFRRYNRSTSKDRVSLKINRGAYRGEHHSDFFIKSASFNRGNNPRSGTDRGTIIFTSPMSGSIAYSVSRDLSFYLESAPSHVETVNDLNAKYGTNLDADKDISKSVVYFENGTKNVVNNSQRDLNEGSSEAFFLKSDWYVFVSVHRSSRSSKYLGGFSIIIRSPEIYKLDRTAIKSYLDTLSKEYEDDNYGAKPKL